MTSRYWRDDALGTPRELTLRDARLRVFEAGAGEPLVFVHGALVNANLWRKVVPLLARDFRCVTLDLPLGSHELPVPDADLTAPGLADLIAEAVTALDLPAPTLVANDTGGALTQIALARHPKLAARLVLTSCDAYENFPPRVFKVLLAPARFPALARALFAPLRLRSVRGTPFAYGWLMRSRLDERAGDSYVLPLLTEKAIGADFARVTLDTKYTFEAIAALRTQDRPTLLAWSREDKFFPQSYAKRLAADIPGARLEWIDDAYTFSMEDQPARLAELITTFVRETPLA